MTCHSRNIMVVTFILHVTFSIPSFTIQLHERGHEVSNTATGKKGLVFDVLMTCTIAFICT